MANKSFQFCFKVILSGFIAISLSACSSDNAKEPTQENAQDIYNGLKGTYQGSVLVDNIPQSVIITIANDFSVRRLPLKPILSRIFTDESMLNEALSSVRDVTFTASTQNLLVTVYNVCLTMQPTDFIFHVTIGGEDYQINALIKSEVYKMGSNTISVNLEIAELTCDGKPYNLTNASIIYNIDLASKLDN